MTLESLARTIAMAPGYNVHITDTASGATRTYRMDCSWEDHHDFLWGEGNYSCDCNRHLFFTRIAKLNDEDPKVQCGYDRFRVHITSDDGQELYSDN